jgi:hypothetical protein
MAGAQRCHGLEEAWRNRKAPTSRRGLTSEAVIFYEHGIALGVRIHGHGIIEIGRRHARNRRAIVENRVNHMEPLVLLARDFLGGTGLAALLCVSFFMSLMFPTIFAIGIKGPGGQLNLWSFIHRNGDSWWYRREVLSKLSTPWKPCGRDGDYAATCLVGSCPDRGKVAIEDSQWVTVAPPCSSVSPSASYSP